MYPVDKRGDGVGNGHIQESVEMKQITQKQIGGVWLGNRRVSAALIVSTI